MPLDLEADIAATPRAPFRYGLPGRVWVDLTRRADSFDPGQVPAHDARCPRSGTGSCPPRSRRWFSGFGYTPASKVTGLNELNWSSVYGAELPVPYRYTSPLE